MSFSLPSHHDMKTLKNLLVDYASGINTEGELINDGIPTSAFCMCYSRQKQNSTVETLFKVEDGTPMMVIKPEFFPEKTKCLTLSELDAMDYHPVYNADDTIKILDNLVIYLNETGYIRSFGHSGYRDESDDARIKEWFDSDDKKRLLPRWFINAMEIANDMQCEYADFSKAEWHIKAKIRLRPVIDLIIKAVYYISLFIIAVCIMAFREYFFSPVVLTCWAIIIIGRIYSNIEKNKVVDYYVTFWGVDKDNFLAELNRSDDFWLAS